MFSYFSNQDTFGFYANKRKDRRDLLKNMILLDLNKNKKVLYTDLKPHSPPFIPK